MEALHALNQARLAAAEAVTAARLTARYLAAAALVAEDTYAAGAYEDAWCTLECSKVTLKVVEAAYASAVRDVGSSTTTA